MKGVEGEKKTKKSGRDGKGGGEVRGAEERGSSRIG